MTSKVHPHNSQGPRLVAWEVTRNCNLDCVHCRAAAGRGPHQGELDTAKCLQIVDQIKETGKPIVILTGGEPLLRQDVFEIARYGTEKDLRMVMATNGTLITKKVAEKMKSSGIQRVSISLDGPDAGQHDRFRKVIGAFDGALRGIELLKKEGIEFQINTTITKHNVRQAEQMLRLAVNLGAAAHHIFLLVPTGRARDMTGEEIDGLEYERLLHWFYGMRNEVNIHLKATCAPHYYRILREQAHKRGEKVDYATYGLDAMTRGCLGGTSFCFVSHVGMVQPCGYLELDCGDLKKRTFRDVWENSPVFLKLRDFSAYKGKCGRCEYVRVCGGCRARAYESTGDFLEEEPLCTYRPARKAIHG